MRIILFVLFVLFVAIVFSTVCSPVLACDCEVVSIESAANEHDVAFIATVAKEANHFDYSAPACKKYPDWCRGEGDYTYDAKVEGVWKGSVPATATLATGSGNGDCSFGRLRKAKRWIVIAENGKDGVFRVRTCSATQPANDDAIARLTKKFGAPKPPK